MPSVCSVGLRLLPENTRFTVELDKPRAALLLFFKDHNETVSWQIRLLETPIITPSHITWTPDAFDNILVKFENSNNVNGVFFAKTN